MPETRNEVTVIHLEDAETQARVMRLYRWAGDHYLTPVRHGGLWCLHALDRDGKPYRKPEFGPASIGACEDDLRFLDQERWAHWSEDGCYGDEPGFEGMSHDAIAAKW